MRLSHLGRARWVAAVLTLMTLSDTTALAQAVSGPPSSAGGLPTGAGAGAGGAGGAPGAPIPPAGSASPCAGFGGINDACKSAAKKHCDDSANQKDPHCSAAALDDAGAAAQLVTSAYYAATSVACGIECAASFGGALGTGGQVCFWMSMGGIAADGGAAAFLAFKGKNVLQEVMTTLVPSAGTSFVAMGGLERLFGPAEESAQAGSQVAKKVTPGQVKRTACVGFAVNGVQSVMRYLNHKNSADQADQERINALPFVQAGTGLQTIDGSSSTRAGGSSGSAPQTGVGGGAVVAGQAPPRFTPEQIARSADTAGLTPAFNKFAELTGKPTSDLFNRLSAGQSPLQATAEQASSQLGQSGLAAVAAFEKAGPEIAGMKDELNRLDQKVMASAHAGFESAPSSGGGEQPAANPMAGLSGLFDSLNPNKPKSAAEESGLSKVQFGNRAPASGKDQGFYPPGTSIFDVVGGRYQLVSVPFLGGADLLHAPGYKAFGGDAPGASTGKPIDSTLPQNIYLSH